MAVKKADAAIIVLRIRGLVFTRNGKPLNRPIPIPVRANDLHFHFDRLKRVITAAWWTLNGRPLIPFIRVPAGANDFHLYL